MPRGDFPVSMKPGLLVLRILTTLLLGVSFTAAQVRPGVAVEQVESQPAAAPKPEPGHAMTEADVGAFLDGFMPMQLERENIAGAVVLVVKDGRVLFAKGYCYSDVDKKTPVTVDATLFRPGSISKLFTWTAVMQLVEQGKLDLDKDINAYLDLRSRSKISSGKRALPSPP